MLRISGALSVIEEGLSLDSFHICGLFSLRTIYDFEFNLVVFIQTAESFTLKSREMDEYVLATFLFNETISLLIIEPLNSTLGHYNITSLQ